MYKVFFILIFFGISEFSYSQMLTQEGLDTCYIYTTLEKALKEPNEVFILNLSKNKLKEFPMEILTFKNLNILNLGKNRLKSIPDGIANFIHLQELNLERNKLEEFPIGIVELVNLKKLILNQNYIVGIPFMIKNIQKLEYLDMWSNDLSTFPESLKELKNLKEFDLRVIQFTNEEKERISNLLPNTKIHFSASCNCGS